MEYKVAEKPIVRESKVRNVFHKVCKKELFYTNLKINAQSEELLKSSASLFAYPSSIGGGSCLAVSKLNSYGKAPDTPFCIKGHTDPISCFEFSPFHDHVLATGSRDCTVKLWKVPEDEAEFKAQSILSTPLITLPKQAKRVVNVSFHQSVDSLFLTSTLDHSIEMWDLSEEPKSIQKLTGAEDMVMSTSWNTWSGGNMLASSSRDKKMRIYDPRASSTPVQEVMTHEGAQGFKLCWADSNGLDLLCTVGANKSAQRQLFLWDPRQISKQVQQYNVTTDSSILNPFFDYGTNILYLGGKGDGIYYYEIDKSNAHLLGKSTFGNVTQSAISLLPKSVVDVQLCEIDRFLRLTSNSIEMVSFIVPRKTTQYFQEDIFPASPSGDPTTDCEDWFKDKSLKVTPQTKSMKPESMTSVYDISEEDGGKSKQKDKLDQISNIIGHNSINSSTGSSEILTEAMIKLEVDGWLFNSYEPRYLKIHKDTLYCFLNEDAAQAIWETPILSIKFVDIYTEMDPSNPYQSSNDEWSTRFNVILHNSKEYHFECKTVEERDQWINSINIHRELKKSVQKETFDSPTVQDFHIVSNSPGFPSPANISNRDAKGYNTLPLNLQHLNISDQKPKNSLLSRNSSASNLLKLSGGMTPPSGGGSGSSTPPLITVNNNNNNANNNSSNGILKLKDNEIIIEGLLTELIPGLLWNTNQEKWFVISEGMLYSYRNKSVKNIEQPMETIHLEKAISVHKTKEIFKVPGFSFQLSTPNRIIHFLSKTKEDRSSWFSVLKQNLKSSSEAKPSPLIKSSKPDSSLKSSTGIEGEEIDNPTFDESSEQNEGGIEEEEEEQIIEGQIFRKHNGFLSMWGKCYMSLCAEDLFLAKSKTATVPELRIQLSNINSIKKVNPQEFTLFDNSDQVVCFFKTLVPPTEEFDDCSRWVEGLEAARKRSIDIIKLFGLSEKSMDEENDSSSSLDRYLDLTAIKNGKQKILIQVKGKRKVRVRLAKLSVDSLNIHNTFILDAGPRIFIWAGSKASRVNKAKAVDFANRIRQKERGGKSTLIQLDEGKNDDSVPEFWDILGGKTSGRIRDSPTQEEQDSEFIKTSIYRVGLDVKKNQLRARLAWEGSDWKLPNKEILHTRFVFVIDCQSEIFVWMGKESSSNQRKMAMKVASALYSQPDRQSWTKITRVNEFGEHNLFKEKFANYPGMLPISTTKQETKSHIATSRAEHKISDLVERLQNPKHSYLEEVIFTDLSLPDSKLTIWKIEDFEKIPHPANLYSQFFSGDSYIVLYTYKLNNKEAHVIYYYLGRDSSINEKGTSAYLTVDLNESLSGQCVQTRVVQNKECRNFLNLFKGRMVVHRGKFVKDFESTKPTSLYEIRGIDQVDCRAQQVDLSVQSLNTQHSFILKTSDQKIFVWYGKNSSTLEREFTKSLLKENSFFKSSETIEIEESKETNEFLSYLGGNNLDTYYNYKLIQNATSTKYLPRFYICTNSSGINEVTEECYPFSQDDLDINSIAILDVSSHLYIWLGTRASHRTKKTSMEVVLEFVKSSKLGHSLQSTQILVVEPYQEPIAFRSYFRSWSFAKYPKNKLPIQEKPGEPVLETLKNYQREIYTYEELLADPLPAGVDPKKLENYLPDDQFEKIFNMERKEFEKIPAWKREGIKKNVFLF